MLILLVDNNLFYTYVLNEMLHKAGFNHVQYVENGLECILQMYKKDIPDVLIIDEGQCSVNGVDVLQNTRNSKSDLTIIVLTEGNLPGDANKKLKKGATLHLSKDSLNAGNLPKMLYGIFTENIVTNKKRVVSRAFSRLKEIGSLN